MGILSLSKLRRYAGGMRSPNAAAAFSSRTNASKFKNILRKKGYSPYHIKSSGPVVDGKGRKFNAYYVLRGEKRALPKRKLRLKRTLSRGNVLGVDLSRLL